MKYFYSPSLICNRIDADFLALKAVKKGISDGQKVVSTRGWLTIIHAEFGKFHKSNGWKVGRKTGILVFAKRDT